jgi:hypothetical protein
MFNRGKRFLSGYSLILSNSTVFFSVNESCFEEIIFSPCCRENSRGGILPNIFAVDWVNALLVKGREHHVTGVDGEEHVFPLAVVELRTDEHALDPVQQRRVQIQAPRNQLQEE